MKEWKGDPNGLLTIWSISLTAFWDWVLMKDFLCLDKRVKESKEREKREGENEWVKGTRRDSLVRGDWLQCSLFETKDVYQLDTNNLCSQSFGTVEEKRSRKWTENRECWSVQSWICLSLFCDALILPLSVLFYDVVDCVTDFLVWWNFCLWIPDHLDSWM